MYFANRTDAGKQLGLILAKKTAGKQCVVYGLPRGGVVVAVEVAKALHAPLDLLVVRKLGHPGNPEYAIGAISESGYVAKGPDFSDVNTDDMQRVIAKEKAEITRRVDTYIGKRKRKDVSNKIAIIVDDGIATGLTMQAAIEEIKQKNPAEIIIAVGVMPKEIEDVFRNKADVVVSLLSPTDFLGSVGSYYESFSQTTDEEVVALLQEVADPFVFFVDAVDSLTKTLLKKEGMRKASHTLSFFPNGELCVSLHNTVLQKDCIVVSSFSQSSLFSLFLLVDTLEKEGARSILCILPYLPYSRQDANEKLKSQGYIWVGDMLRSSGVSKLITVDVHNAKLIDYFPVPLTSISTAELFAKEIQEIGWQDATVVAPDEGAKNRCQEVATMLGKRSDVAYCKKKRNTTGIESSSLFGSISHSAIIVDDMLDTGKTLIACCQSLVEKDVKKIIIFVTHGFFTGDTWKQLWHYPVEKIYCTDTIPLSVKDKRISVLSVSEKIAEEVSKNYV